MSKKTKIKKVKAYALIQEDGYLPPFWNHNQSVFCPRVFVTKEGAKKVSDVVITGGPKLKVVPCTITYKSNA